MLSEILKKKAAAEKAYNDNKAANHIEEYNRMVVLKNQLDEVSEGILKYDIKFAEASEYNLNNNFTPSIIVTNVCHGTIQIRGSIEALRVNSLCIFNLGGETHTIESFFKKISIYL